MVVLGYVFVCFDLMFCVRCIYCLAWVLWFCFVVLYNVGDSLIVSFFAGLLLLVGLVGLFAD